MHSLNHDRRTLTASRAGSSRRRGRPSTASLVLGGVFLALCSWLVIPTGERELGAHHASIHAAPHTQPNATLELEAALDTTRPRMRAEVLELVPSEVMPAAAIAVRPPATAVWGALLDVAGAPIGGEARAHVRFVDRSGRLRPCDATDDGEYAVESLTPGTHWVTASAEGYQAEVKSIELSADRPRLRLDFTLQEAVEVRVHIVLAHGASALDLEPARRLLPIATREPLGARHDKTDVDTPSVGRFQARDGRSLALPPDCVGLLIMESEEPAWVSLLHESIVIQTQRVVAGQGEVTFLIGQQDLSSRSAVRVRVLDALTGLPLHRARVRLSGEANPVGDELADEQGFATVEGAAAGRAELLVRVKTYAELRLPIDVLQAAVTEVGTITLEPEVTVSGRVLDLEGRPRAADFTLGIVDPADRSLRWSSRASYQSREDGSFVIRGLARGEYVIRSSDDNRGPGADWRGIATVSGNVVLDTRAGSITGLEVRVRPAAKLVLHTSIRRSGSVSFRVVDTLGLEVAAGSLRGSEPRAIELRPGVYRVWSLGVGDTVLSDHTVELGSDVITLDLARR